MVSESQCETADFINLTGCRSQWYKCCGATSLCMLLPAPVNLRNVTGNIGLRNNVLLEGAFSALFESVCHNHR